MLKIITTLLVTLSFTMGTFSQQLSRDQLIDDTKQLIHYIEACHPDPYVQFEGKIGFHNALYDLLNSYPENGMNVQEFWWKLSGFLARIKDGHTYLYPVKYPDPENPGGIPIRFKVLADKSMVICNVCDKEQQNWIGARLVSINQIKVPELLNRASEIYPRENIFDAFRNLKTYLWYGDFLSRLLPTWRTGEDLTMEFLDETGILHQEKITTGNAVSYKPINSAPSSIKLPRTDRCDFVYNYFDDSNIAYFKIAKQDEFREYAEQSIAELKNITDPGTLAAYRQQYLQIAKKWHRRYHQEEPPDSLELIIARLPSFSEFMENMVTDFKNRKTQTLIIDLRENQGGISLLSDIMIYYFYGKMHMNQLNRDSYSITYLSPVNAKIASSLNPELINQSRGKNQDIPLKVGDYDFYSYTQWKVKDSFSLDAESNQDYSSTPTFQKEYINNNYSGYYAPENIFVICSDKTFSAGFETLTKLKKSGAAVVGVSPAQSGNCFGMGIYPIDHLTHSGIKFQVSVRQIMEYPSDPITGHILTPEIPLDYPTYQKYHFDSNAAVLLALDLIANATPGYSGKKTARQKTGKH